MHGVALLAKLGEGFGRLTWATSGRRSRFAKNFLNARLGSANVGILEQVGLVFVDVSGSTNHFNRGINLFGAIDHLAHGPGAAPFGEPVVVRRKFEGDWPTDHYPLVADFIKKP